MVRSTNTDQDQPMKKGYTLKPVTKPLCSRKGEEVPLLSPQKDMARDITEDDDGYHPYADVPDTRPLFERDPWR